MQRRDLLLELVDILRLSLQGIILILESIRLGPPLLLVLNILVPLVEGIPQEVPLQVMLAVTSCGTQVVAVVSRVLRASHAVVVVVLVISILIELAHLLLVFPSHVD